MKSKVYSLLLFLSCLLWLGGAPAGASDTPFPLKTYWVYVLSESADEISLVRLDREGARVERRFKTGNMPSDLSGPHGIVVSPDKRYYYVSLGHGRPYGTALKYSSENDRILGQTTLGLFPATASLTPNGELLFVVNFNLHGDMVPSSVSVVATEDMLEIARIPTCVMPHGSRVNPQGTFHYSACMMDDLLVELDTRALKVSRHFLLTKGLEKGMAGSPSGENPMVHGAAACSPTWAQPSVDGTSIFVACNRSSEIVEIDANTWTLKRRIPARPGVYNLSVTNKGRMVATNKRDQSISIYDLTTGKELSRIPTSKKIVHGVTVSPDDLYAFVSVEGIGSESGLVEVVDLTRLEIIAEVSVGPQAAGIDFMKMTPP